MKSVIIIVTAITILIFLISIFTNIGTMMYETASQVKVTNPFQTYDINTKTELLCSLTSGELQSKMSQITSNNHENLREKYSEQVQELEVYISSGEMQRDYNSMTSGIIPKKMAELEMPIVMNELHINPNLENWILEFLTGNISIMEINELGKNCGDISTISSESKFISELLKSDSECDAGTELVNGVCRVIQNKESIENESSFSFEIKSADYGKQWELANIILAKKFNKAYAMVSYSSSYSKEKYPVGLISLDTENNLVVKGNLNFENPFIFSVNESKDLIYLMEYWGTRESTVDDYTLRIIDGNTLKTLDSIDLNYDSEQFRPRNIIVNNLLDRIYVLFVDMSDKDVNSRVSKIIIIDTNQNKVIDEIILDSVINSSVLNKSKNLLYFVSFDNQIFVLDENNHITTYGPISENPVGHLTINEKTNRGYVEVGDNHGRFIEILEFDLNNPENILNSIKNSKFGNTFPLYIAEEHELLLFNNYLNDGSRILLIDIHNESNSEVGTFLLGNTRHEYLRGFDEENHRIYYSTPYGIGVSEIILPINDDLRQELFPFVDTTKDPFYYIDRFENEPKYNKWFNENYPKHTIFEAVGISEEEYAEYITSTSEPESNCEAGTKLVDGICKVI